MTVMDTEVRLHAEQGSSKEVGQKRKVFFLLVQRPPLDTVCFNILVP